MWENISILITSWGNMIITGIQLIIPILITMREINVQVFLQ